jgi:ATP-dependent DNA helicase RecQ
MRAIKITKNIRKVETPSRRSSSVPARASSTRSVRSEGSKRAVRPKPAPALAAAAKPSAAIEPTACSWLETIDADQARRSFYESTRSPSGKALLIGPSLNALARDQAELLEAGRAAALIALDGGVVDARELAKLEQRGSLLVLVTSDALTIPDVRRILEKTRWSAVAIDDAHLLARSAHEFRPSFARVAELAIRFKSPLVQLLSRPCRPELHREVEAILASPTLVHRAEPNAPLLGEGVIVECRAVRGERRTPALLEALRSYSSGPGVVLCASPHEVDANYAALTDAGLHVCRAHAGMPEADRDAALARFAADLSGLTLITTSAVGANSGLLGIAESRGARLGLGFGRTRVRRDLRFVIHFHAPASLEQYVQEIGWIGRDGLAGGALLFYDSAQRSLNESVLEQQRYSPKQLMTLVRLLAEEPLRVKTLTLEWLALQSGQSRRTTERLVALLLDAGLASRAGNVISLAVTPAELAAAGEQLATRLAELQAGDAPRLNAVERFAEGKSCRREALLRHFVKEAEPCGKCSWCARRGAEAGRSAESRASRKNV